MISSCCEPYGHFFSLVLFCVIGPQDALFSRNAFELMFDRLFHPKQVQARHKGKGKRRSGLAKKKILTVMSEITFSIASCFKGKNCAPPVRKSKLGSPFLGPSQGRKREGGNSSDRTEVASLTQLKLSKFSKSFFFKNFSHRSLH